MSVIIGLILILLAVRVLSYIIGFVLGLSVLLKGKK